MSSTVKANVSSKERQQRYRDKLKLDPDRYNASKEKERGRWIKRKELSKVKGINDMTPREQRSVRKKWSIRRELRKSLI